jgi:hypothetical protein
MRVSDLSRAQLVEVGMQLLQRLKDRQAKGPPEPILDMFIPQLEELLPLLSTHVEGKVISDAARKAMLLRLENADIDVDTWLRHIESFLRVEATRRDGPHVAAAKATHRAAFPKRISHVNDYIPVQNRICRESVAVLQSKEHAPTLVAIDMPPAWIPKWIGCLDESDAAWAAVKKTRETKTDHVEGGRGAEADLVDVVVRYRKAVDSRASYKDKEKLAEGKELLWPLTDALQKLHTDQAARATRREQAEETGQTGSEEDELDGSDEPGTGSGENEKK